MINDMPDSRINVSAMGRGDLRELRHAARVVEMIYGGDLDKFNEFYTLKTTGSAYLNLRPFTKKERP